MNQFKVRKYGDPPFDVAVVHGGPGAPGYMAPVARELSSRWGVVEPLQSATTLEGQIQELSSSLIEYGNLPITLIGHSWGAMLGYLLTARYPELVEKLIMVGSGVFTEEYVEVINQNRIARAPANEIDRIHELLFNPDSLESTDNDRAFAKLGELFTKTDSYDPVTLNLEWIEIQHEVYKKVWPAVVHLRDSGELLDLGSSIQCPVVAIHGDYDPHPFEGIEKPLTPVLKHFRFILLTECGHYPWIERKARDRFYTVLNAELR